MTSRRKVLGIVAASSGAWTLRAFADQYPTRPIRLVVPFPAGGPTDIVARPLSVKLAEGLGQQVIVDNRGGAGGNVGAELVAKSPPDGYTLFVGTVGTHAINATLYKHLNYSPSKDFIPVSQVAAAPLLLVANPSVPVNNIRELIALAKQKPGMLNYGSAGSGSPGHLSGELFKSMAGVDITHVPYKGSAPALTDLRGGQIQLMFDPIQSPMPHVKAHVLKALGVSSLKRSPLLPDVPTIDEAGVPGYQTAAWWGIFAPTGTPQVVIDRLHREVIKIVYSGFFKQQLEPLGAEPVSGTQEQFADFVKLETIKWGKIVRESGAVVD